MGGKGSLYVIFERGLLRHSQLQREIKSLQMVNLVVWPETKVTANGYNVGVFLQPGQMLCQLRAGTSSRTE